jgi:hypothetical protein
VPTGVVELALLGIPLRSGTPSEFHLCADVSLRFDVDETMSQNPSLRIVSMAPERVARELRDRVRAKPRS